MAKTQGVSLNPEDFTEGGLLDDANVEWKNVSFVMWDYNGRIPDEQPALKVILDQLDGNLNSIGENEVEQYWSVGSSKDWVASKDGRQLVPVGAASSLRQSSNAAILLSSLINCGFPGDKLNDGDVGVLEGLQCHMIRQAAPKRRGLERAPREDGREFEATILTVDEIHKLPWEKKKPKGAPKGAKAKGAAAGDEDEVKEAATSFLMEALGDAGDDGVLKKDLPTLAFKALKDSPHRTAVSKLVWDDDFLNDGPWEYDGTKVTMG